MDEIEFDLLVFFDEIFGVFYSCLHLLEAESRGNYFSRYSLCLFFIEEFQWFFIELSVLPLRCLAISAQRLPTTLCAKYRMYSSMSDHSLLVMSGLRWLCHLSLHCLPVRPESIELYWGGDRRWWPIFVLRISALI